MSCKKQDDFLSAKRNKGDITPEAVADFQAMLDDDGHINALFASDGLAGTDNLLLTDAGLSSATEQDRKAYNWSEFTWVNGKSSSWNYLFQTIGTANIVLEGLEKISESEQNYHNVKGQAAFYRAMSTYTLAQLFCKTYDPATSSSDLGLPLRLSSDVNIIYQRSTVQATYEQMLNDAKTAAGELPENSIYNTRPIKAAANALLSKIFLIMGDYNKALESANSCLNNSGNILDYNSSGVNPSSTYRFPTYGINNPEIIWFARANPSFNSVYPSSSSYGEVDTALYASYANNDLRKSVLYKDKGKGHAKFQGTYSGNFSNFCGIATNEVYLIRAECLARLSKTTDAMADLNKLLKNRYRTGTYQDIKVNTAEEALTVILRERRKELPFTSNIRWEDLRRLNKDSRFAITIRRVIKGFAVTLPPNDPKYVLPIPEQEILLSGIKQNER